MKEDFNVFTNEDADYTKPMDINGEFKDIVSDIAFDGQTRRQFLRRLTNGLVGVGAVNNIGQIIYKTHDDKVIGGHRVDVKINSDVEEIKASFKPNDQYKSERGRLMMPIVIKNRKTDRINDKIVLDSKCEHEQGYQYESKEFINQLQNKEVRNLIITDKDKIAKFGKPREINLFIFTESNV